MDEYREFSGSYVGRKVLKYAHDGILDAKAIATILDSGIMQMHQENSRDIDTLYWFYRGDQPILKRSKNVRPEINNKIVENRAYEIVEFKKGYSFSHPIQYTNAGKGDTDNVSSLNTFARIDGKEAKDLQIAEWRYICGLGHRITLPMKNLSEDEAPYYTEALDPRTTFIVYKAGIKETPLFSVSYTKQDKSPTETTWLYGVYTDTHYYEWKLQNEYASFTDVPPDVMGNPLGMNPIVEYPLNNSRLGYIDLAYSLCNAINAADSNRLDGIEQFIQSILWFNNCEIDTGKWEELTGKNGGAIMTRDLGGMKATVAYLVQQLNQSEVQVTKDDLLTSLYEICGHPSRQQSAAGGGDTGQAVVLRNGWGDAEARAQSDEKIFKKSEFEYLKRVLKICRELDPESIKDITLKDIDIKFTRNRSDNMQMKSQTLSTLLAAGVDMEDAFETCELFGDSVAVCEKSRKEQEEKAKKQAKLNPVIVPNEVIEVERVDESAEPKENETPQGESDK